jgi:hypothetical protein
LFLRDQNFTNENSLKNPFFMAAHMLRVLFLSLQCAASGGERRAEEDYCACRSPYCGTVPRFSAEPSASAPDEPREPRIARANSARVRALPSATIRQMGSGKPLTGIAYLTVKKIHIFLLTAGYIYLSIYV